MTDLYTVTSTWHSKQMTDYWGSVMGRKKNVIWQYRANSIGYIWLQKHPHFIKYIKLSYLQSSEPKLRNKDIEYAMHTVPIFIVVYDPLDAWVTVPRLLQHPQAIYQKPTLAPRWVSMSVPERTNQASNECATLRWWPPPYWNSCYPASWWAR